MKHELKALSLLSLILPFVLCTPAEARHGWSPAGDLLVAVNANDAFALSDGRVVSVGLVDASESWPATTQYWSFGTNEWKAAASTPALPDLYQGVAVMLDDGRILVTGYCEKACHDGSNAELYDPAIDAWTMSGQMKAGRYQHAAVKLLDGRVLVIGGCTDEGGAWKTPSVEIFDPATQRFSPAAPMHMRRAGLAATLLADGRVLVTGGINVMGVLSENEIYDPARNVWSVNAPMKDAHQFHVAVAMADGRVLVAGGACTPDMPCDKAETFDPATGAWTRAGHLSVPREYAAAVTLQDGTVLVAGGLSRWGTLWRYMETAERFDPVQNRFVHARSMVHQRGGFSMALLRDGRVLAVGGDAWVNGDPKIPGDAELYTP